jgi:hypothetical protein
MLLWRGTGVGGADRFKPLLESRALRGGDNFPVHTLHERFGSN